MTLVLHYFLFVCLLPLLCQAVARHSKPNNISSSCLCPLWVTLSIWAETSSHTQPIYRCNFILVAAKIILCCLFDRVFISIFMSACAPSHPQPPPHEYQLDRTKILMRSKSALPKKGFQGVLPLKHFWPFEINFLQFYDRFACFMSISTCKLSYCGSSTVVH